VELGLRLRQEAGEEVQLEEAEEEAQLGGAEAAERLLKSQLE
jgi:hypothetical protein